MSYKGQKYGAIVIVNLRQSNKCQFSFLITLSFRMWASDQIVAMAIGPLYMPKGTNVLCVVCVGGRLVPWDVWCERDLWKTFLVSGSLPAMHTEFHNPFHCLASRPQIVVQMYLKGIILLGYVMNLVDLPSLT